MADKEIKKVFDFNGIKLTAVKMNTVKVKVGILRKVEAQQIEGLCSLVKIVTGAADEVLDELDMQDLSDIVVWATDI